MRGTQCDRDQDSRTLRSGVRGQNEGKIGTFGCDTKAGPKLTNIRPFNSPHISRILHIRSKMTKVQRSSTLNSSFG